MSRASRYIAEDGKLFEIVERDPERRREIDLRARAPGRVDLARCMAVELNEAEHKGREAVKRSFRILLGIR